MITTGEARRAAEEWLHSETAKYAEFVGAILAGSTRRRDPAEPHPPGSDVDLFLYVEAEVPSDILEPRGRFAPRKLAFHGVVLEPSFHNARELANPETVLGDTHLAPLFTAPCILLDPSGRLAALAAAVTPDFLRRRHAQRRLTQALEAATPTSSPFAVPDTPALRAPCWRNVAYRFGLLTKTLSSSASEVLSRCSSPLGACNVLLPRLNRQPENSAICLAGTAATLSWRRRMLRTRATSSRGSKGFRT